jgi:hypothetical protein
MGVEPLGLLIGHCAVVLPGLQKELPEQEASTSVIPEQDPVATDAHGGLHLAEVGEEALTSTVCGHEALHI